MKKINIKLIKTVAFLSVLLCVLSSCAKKPKTDSELYNTAVIDAMIAEPQEIMPLVCVSKDEKLISWKDDRVLMLTMHKYPDSYPESKPVTLSFGNSWTFTDKEMKAWYDKNKTGVTDWSKRLQQLLGTEPHKTYTHISAFWTKPEDIRRPAYQIDATKQIEPKDLDGSSLGELHSWFCDNIISSYYIGEKKYPWTRLGYTYDWNDNKTAYGLTEFLVLKNANVQVEFTKTIPEFIEWLENQ